MRTGVISHKGRSMHYEKAPRFRRPKPDEAPPPLRCAVQGFAPLRRRLGVTGVDLRWERTTESLGKSAGEWHFTLEGKTSVGTNDLSPQGGNYDESRHQVY